jgi:hypothetical protein
MSSKAWRLLAWRYGFLDKITTILSEEKHSTICRNFSPSVFHNKTQGFSFRRIKRP